MPVKCLRSMSQCGDVERGNGDAGGKRFVTMPGLRQSPIRGSQTAAYDMPRRSKHVRLKFKSLARQRLESRDA